MVFGASKKKKFKVFLLTGKCLPSVAAQHEWILRQLQPGGGRGLFLSMIWKYITFMPSLKSGITETIIHSHTFQTFETLLLSAEINLRGWTGKLGASNIRV